MTQSRQTLGRFGEEAAAEYLRARGWSIRGQNVRTRSGELDLIAWDGQHLVFIEVKTRRSLRFGAPQESVDWRKRARIAAAARVYLANQRLVDTFCRFDVMTVTWDGEGGEPIIHHIVDAFRL